MSEIQTTFIGTWSGEKQDSPADDNVSFFRAFVGWDISQPGQVNKWTQSVSPEGFRPLNYRPANIAPNMLNAPNVSTYAGTMSFMAYKFPTVAGNVLAAVRNGPSALDPAYTPTRGQYHDIGPCSGGSYAAAWYETWGGTTPVTIPSDADGYSFTVPPVYQYARDGYEVFRAPNEWGCTFGHIRNCSVASHGRMRPFVFENQGSGLVGGYNAGITPPIGPGDEGGPPAITAAAHSPGLIGRFRFAVCRVDTTNPGRLRTSLLTEATDIYDVSVETGFTFTGLTTVPGEYTGDAETDRWDSLGLCVFDADEEIWYLAEVDPPADSLAVQISNTTLQEKPQLASGIDGVTGVNWVFPSVRNLVNLNISAGADGLVERLVGGQQVGYDQFAENRGIAPTGVPGATCPTFWKDQYFTPLGYGNLTGSLFTSVFNPAVVPNCYTQDGVTILADCVVPVLEAVQNFAGVFPIWVDRLYTTKVGGQGPLINPGDTSALFNVDDASVVDGGAAHYFMLATGYQADVVLQRASVSLPYQVSMTNLGAHAFESFGFDWFVRACELTDMSKLPMPVGPGAARFLSGTDADTAYLLLQNVNLTVDLHLGGTYQGVTFAVDQAETRFTRTLTSVDTYISTAIWMSDPSLFLEDEEWYVFNSSGVQYENVKLKVKHVANAYTSGYVGFINVGISGTTDSYTPTAGDTVSQTIPSPTVNVRDGDYLATAENPSTGEILTRGFITDASGTSSIYPVSVRPGIGGYAATIRNGDHGYAYVAYGNKLRKLDLGSTVNAAPEVLNTTTISGIGSNTIIGCWAFLNGSSNDVLVIVATQEGKVIQFVDATESTLGTAAPVQQGTLSMSVSGPMLCGVPIYFNAQTRCASMLFGVSATPHGFVKHVFFGGTGVTPTNPNSLDLSNGYNYLYACCPGGDDGEGGPLAYALFGASAQPRGNASQTGVVVRVSLDGSADPPTVAQVDAISLGASASAVTGLGWNDVQSYAIAATWGSPGGVAKVNAIPGGTLAVQNSLTLSSVDYSFPVVVCAGDQSAAPDLFFVLSSSGDEADSELPCNIVSIDGASYGSDATQANTYELANAGYDYITPLSMVLRPGLGLDLYVCAIRQEATTVDFINVSQVSGATIYVMGLSNNYSRTTPNGELPPQFDYSLVALDDTRWRIQQQVTATFTNGSRRVELSHPVAAQWMVWQDAVCTTSAGAEINGGTIFKIASNNSNSLDDGQTLGDTLILTAPYEGTTVTGFFSTRPDNSSVWFGLGSAAAFDQTSPVHQADLETTQTIATIGFVKARLCVVMQQNQLFMIETSGGIADPVDLATFAEFDITSQLNVNRLDIPHSCVAPWSFSNTPNGDGIWVGAEGPWLCDGDSTTLITQGWETDRWADYYPPGLILARTVCDSTHKYGPVIRVFNLASNATAMVRGETSAQLVYVLDRKSWLNFSASFDIGAGSMVKSYAGQERFLFGSHGRLYLTGAQGGTTQPDACYAMPTTGGNQTGEATGDVNACEVLSDNVRLYGTTPKSLRVTSREILAGSTNYNVYRDGANVATIQWTGLPVDPTGTGIAQFQLAGDSTEYVSRAGDTIVVSNGTSLVDNAANFYKPNQWLWYYSNIRVVKWDIESGQYETAIITSAESGVELNVTPTTTWTFIEGKTYQYVIGPRYWQITLPTMWATHPYATTAFEAFNLNCESTSAVDMPLRYYVFDSDQKATIENLKLTRTYLQSDFNVQWADQTWALPSTNRWFLLVEGFHPPATNLVLRSVEIGSSPGG